MIELKEIQSEATVVADLKSIPVIHTSVLATEIHLQYQDTVPLNARELGHHVAYVVG